MKRINENIKELVTVNKQKVITYTLAGLVFGLCVGYTFAKLAQWLMKVH